MDNLDIERKLLKIFDLESETVQSIALEFKAGKSPLLKVSRILESSEAEELLETFELLIKEKSQKVEQDETCKSK